MGSTDNTGSIGSGQQTDPVIALDDSVPVVDTGTSEPTDPTVSHEIPVATGSAISDSRINAWWQPFADGYVNGGIYRSGDEGVAATLYAALKYNFFKTDFGPFTAQSTGAFGVAGVIPEDDFENRYMLLAMPSIRASIGGEHELFDGVKFREGLQLSAMVPIGFNYSIDYMIPIEVGAAIGKEFSEDTSFSVGVIGHMYLESSDVQDMGALALNSNDIDVLFNLRTSYVDVMAGLQFFNNETSVFGRISANPFDLLGGTAVVGLEGGGSIDADNVALPWSLRIYLSWAYESEDKDWGISGQTSLNPIYDQYQENATFSNVSHQYGIVEMETMGSVYGYDANGDTMACTYSGQRREGDEFTDIYNCEVLSSDSSTSLPATCEETGTRTVTCTVPLQAGVVQFTANGSLQPDPDVISHATVNSGMTISEGDAFVRQLFQNDNLDSFTSALDSSSSHDKIAFLVALNDLLYKTYDHDGLVTANGAGEVNDMTPQEMYRRIRLHLIDPDHSLPTSVCRGIANFTTYLADRWGFEAHSIGIHTSDMGHVVTMLRKRGAADPYEFIVQGRTVSTSAHTLAEAVESFNANQGYPAPLFIRSYGPDGKLERVIMTNEGQMLFESIAPADWLTDFLSF